MDLSPCIPVLEAIGAGEIKATPTVAPIQYSGLHLQLNRANFAPRRKEGELSHFPKVKKTEKSKGHLEKLDARDKDAKANANRKRRERAKKKDHKPPGADPPDDSMRQGFG
jgi:hypothetical protein